MQKPEKPSFSVPSMREIAEMPYNGYIAVSTFSGAGGSSLGYRFAGFRVLWANEFIPAAQETYRANFPSAIIDPRDVREIAGSDILRSINCNVGDIDIFDGSPPCAAFSKAGSREKSWGSVKVYSDTKQRVDDLFDEYVRLVRETKPKVFVAENVKELTSGVAKGYFKHVLASLRASGYVVAARILDAQWLGVPQHRERIIFVGVREDLQRNPAFPEPLPYRYTVRDVCPWIIRIRGGEKRWLDADRPAYTVTQSDVRKYLSAALSSGGWVEVDTTLSPFEEDKYIDAPSNTNDYTPKKLRSGYIRRKYNIAELRRIFAFPDDFVLTGDFEQQWERLGRAVPPMMMYHIASTIRREILDKLSKTRER